MPRVRACLVSRCPEYAVSGRPYCRQHIRERPQLGLTGEVRSTRPRGKDARLRRRVFARQHGRCPCGAIATILHHKRTAYDNEIDDLIALCADCHRGVHAAGAVRSLRA